MYVYEIKHLPSPIDEYTVNQWQNGGKKEKKKLANCIVPPNDIIALDTTSKQLSKATNMNVDSTYNIHREQLSYQSVFILSISVNIILI
jgi:hypothetical protein